MGCLSKDKVKNFNQTPLSFHTHPLLSENWTYDPYTLCIYIYKWHQIPEALHLLTTYPLDLYPQLSPTSLNPISFTNQLLAPSCFCGPSRWPTRSWDSLDRRRWSQRCAWRCLSRWCLRPTSCSSTAGEGLVGGDDGGIVFGWWWYRKVLMGGTWWPLMIAVVGCSCSSAWWRF